MINNKIYNLAKQANLIEYDQLPSGALTPVHDSVANTRKFVELLINEMSTIDFYWLDHKDETDVIIALYNHFGLKP